MKNINRYFSLILLAVVGIAMHSCIKENLSDKSSEKVNVTLNFDTRTDENTPVDTDNGEGIKTLRVIITSNDNKVISNIFRDYSSEQPITSSKNLTIMGLEKGNKKFYVVINENSIGLSSYLASIETELPSDFLSKEIQNSNETSYFPKKNSDISSYGLPAIGMIEENLSETNNSFTIPCTHAVAKIILNVTNNSGRKFTVKNVNFGSFFQQSTYLFDRGGDVPTENTKEHSFPLSMEIPVTPELGTPTQTLVCYLFETGPNVTRENFTVALDVDGMDFLKTPAQIMFDSNSPVQYQLPRGYQLNLNAKVTGTEITYGPVTVEKWKEQTIELE